MDSQRAGQRADEVDPHEAAADAIRWNMDLELQAIKALRRRALRQKRKEARRNRPRMFRLEEVDLSHDSIVAVL